MDDLSKFYNYKSEHMIQFVFEVTLKVNGSITVINRKMHKLIIRFIYCEISDILTEFTKLTTFMNSLRTP